MSPLTWRASDPAQISGHLLQTWLLGVGEELRASTRIGFRVLGQLALTQLLSGSTLDLRGSNILIVIH